MVVPTVITLCWIRDNIARGQPLVGQKPVSPQHEKTQKILEAVNHSGLINPVDWPRPLELSVRCFSVFPDGGPSVMDAAVDRPSQPLP